MTPATMNDHLRAYYTDALQQLSMVWEPAIGDSRPMLLAVPPNYLQAPVKLMVVGQETGGWAESVTLDADAAAQLMRFYSDFALGRNQPSTPFWQGARKVYGELNPNGPADAFLWSNLVKVDVRRRRPPAQVETALASQRLLEQELEITVPNALIFFTGPRYDDRLKATFPHVAIDELGGGTARIHGLACRAVRTYHPRYLRLTRRWNELDTAIKVLTDGS